jgi:hypothetical protein
MPFRLLKEEKKRFEPRKNFSSHKKAQKAQNDFLSSAPQLI